jgi:hypothetical protein
MRPEELLQISVCKYISFAYPKVVFTSDASGVRLSMGVAIKLKKMRSSDAIPDLLILEPRGEYHGLMLELKVKSPYLKDGQTLSTTEHVQDQNKTLSKLSKLGYKAQFATGFDESKQVIDAYMALK